MLTDGTKERVQSSGTRKALNPHDAAIYRQRHLIENMFGKLKDWRRIKPATIAAPHRLSAIVIAAVIFWLGRY